MHRGPDGASFSVTRKSRQSLRDYQRQLAERTTSAQASPSTLSRELGFLAAGSGWLIKLNDAAEIMPVPTMTPVPGTHAWFLGLINHRGKLTSVIDFEHFLGGQSSSPTAGGRLMVLSDRFPITCALRVAAVSGLMDFSDAISSEDHAVAETSVSIQPRWQGECLRIRDKSWHRLDVLALMADPRFINAAL
ncbi:MAG: chemotaxis protein CheW [Oxalobacteraceae bacterium]|jgi:twitching motility protein PilI